VPVSVVLASGADGGDFNTTALNEQHCRKRGEQGYGLADVRKAPAGRVNVKESPRGVDNQGRRKMFTFSGLRPLLAIGALGTAYLTVSTAPALADGETCDGKPATMVVSTAPDSNYDWEFPHVNGTSGDDVIVVTTPDKLTVNGLGGDDTICGATLTWIDGGVGNDELWSTYADPEDRFAGHFDGGEGDDVIHGGDYHESINGGLGNDIIFGGDGVDGIYGSTTLTPLTAPNAPDNDTIDAGGGDDYIVDDWGDDTLTGGSGSDDLVLGSNDVDEGLCDVIAANATLTVADGTVTGFGEDTFTGFEAYDGGTRKSTLIGTAGPDDLGSGLCGKTHLVGLGGDDRLSGRSDGDHKEAGVISGNSGNDEISFIGPYDIHAGKGDDQIRLAESDWFDAFPGAEIEGNGGVDWLTLDGFYPGEITSVDLRRGLNTRHPKKLLPIQGVDNARQTTTARSIGWDGPVRMTGTAGPNVLIGLPSTKKNPAILRGLAGNDRLLGGKRDTAYGGPGRDFCRAGQRHGCERG
jgi:hypothetical protein